MPLPVSGEILTATDLTNMFPTNIDGWQTFTPTLVQSGTVTKTVAYGAYMKIGRLVIGNIQMSVTGTGTGSNIVQIGLPLTAASSALVCMGTGYIFDSSTAALYKGLVTLNSTTTITLAATSTTTGGRLGSEAFTAALASGDLVAASFFYEAAS